MLMAVNRYLTGESLATVLLHVQGVAKYRSPPPQQNWAVAYPKPIHFHDPTSIPD